MLGLVVVGDVVVGTVVGRVVDPGVLVADGLVVDCEEEGIGLFDLVFDADAAGVADEAGVWGCCIEPL